MSLILEVVNGQTEAVDFRNEAGKRYAQLMIMNVNELQSSGAELFFYCISDLSTHKIDIRPVINVDEKFDEFYFKTTVIPQVELK